MNASEYGGLLIIGDPHLASRVPGFRKDDYPRTVIDKLTWALEYADQNQLLPTILGDLFHWPRDNSNRLIVQLLDLLGGEILCVTGNHDCKEDDLREDDSLWILKSAGRLNLVDHAGPWHGVINGVNVVVGGTSWGQDLPKTYDRSYLKGDALVFWLTHHDVKFPGYENLGQVAPYEIPGIDVVINGHIHQPLADVVAGKTTWLNPGNITRIKRIAADRTRRPSVLRIDIGPFGWTQLPIELPARPFAEVFHEEAAPADIPLDDSLFIKGLASLESLRTHGGAGLQDFLDKNLTQFDTRVATEIRALAQEVCADDRQQ
jgi:predicted phosphodiesterase